MKRKRLAGACALALFLLLLSACGLTRESSLLGAVEETEFSEEAEFTEETEFSERPETASEAEKKTDRPEKIFVYVCGAVDRPGVYELPSGSRVYEAVALAGGMTADASETAVNQAEELIDGMQVYLPTKEEETAAFTAAAEADDGLVNINTADADLLMTLPGIGESKALSIISYREEHGAFSDISELKNITGIKDGVFTKIKDRIKI